MASLAEIYDWFMTGKKPTQAQFWASWGSFWNKSESIPQSAVSNLSTTLNAKAEKAQFDAHKTAADAHQALFELKQSLSDKGIENGYAPLDEFAKLAAEYLNIVDDLVTGGSTELLSAEQGKVLQGKIDAINLILTSDDVNLDTVQELVDAIKEVETSLESILVNDLVTGGVTKALTAEMGKNLQDNKVDKVAGERLINAAEIAKLSTAGDMLIGTAQTVTETKTFLSGKFGLRNVANTFTSFFTNSNTVSRTYTLPDKNGTVAMTSDLPTNVVNSGTTNYLAKYVSGIAVGISRLWDTGSKLGIGTTKTPLEDLTFGNQSNRTIGVEQSSNTNHGKSLDIIAGRTINYVEGAGFQPLFTGLSGNFSGAVINPINQDVYVALKSVNVYKRTAGSGSFVVDGVGADPFLRGMGVDSSGNVYVAIATGGYKKKVFGGSTWTTVTPAGVTGGGNCIGGNSLGDIYFGTTNGLWKQTGGTGSFVSVWTGNAEQLAISPIDDSIYLFSYANSVLYKQTAGSGAFVNVWNVSLARGICCGLDGHVYVLNGTTLFKQTAGSGSFASMGISLPTGSWGTGLAVDSNSSLYGVAENGSDVYYLDNNAPGTSDLNGGTIRLRAGTGKGTGQSRIEFITGEKIESGTNMQVETTRGYFDEKGNFVCLNIPVYADDSAADADTELPSGAYYRITGSRILYQKP